MENFHVYETIGRGKHSTVYKGRRKKTLEYYAIKSVDKSQRSKVLQEVRALNSLDNPNILKFFFCYETSAHLWLVLEYCVGGDLMSLLRQDKRLPEDSIHDLAQDLVKALQFLHSKGIIYCNLKPSNILLDENGRIKLCDFGLAMHISDISKTTLSSPPLGKRGTPCYMAPELFQDVGVHSFASDFWALGCILYECYVGRPPFIGKEFTQLVNSVLSDAVPPLPNNPSSSFLDLIKRLLVKDPSDRIQWPELCEHSFWRKKIVPVALPSQPAFNHMLHLYAKPCLSECNDKSSTQQRTPSKYGEREPMRVQKQDENFASINYKTPDKNVQSGRKTNNRTATKVADKKKEKPNVAKDVNILRLSRIAKHNLQRENEKGNYRRPFPNTENNAEVNIENTDMELDFNENPEDDTPDESDSACAADGNIPTHSENSEKTEETEVDMNLCEIQLETNVLPLNDVKECEADRHPDNKEAAATPPSVSLPRKALHVKAASGSTPDSDTDKSANNLLEVLWHPSDLSVRPVMPNRRSDKASDALPMLACDVTSASDYAKLPHERLEALNARILHSLGGTSQLSEKHGSLRYLEMLSMNTDAANILTNGPIMFLLVKMLRLSKTSSLRVLVASVIGLMIRHSTLIKPELAACGILNALMDGLRDKQDKVRRFCMAALGELLFYISTQSDHTKDASAIESPLKDTRSAPRWQVPNSVIALVSSLLRKGEDDITQLYALRTIENICSQGGHWASRFANQNVIGNLCYIYKAIGKQESTRITAGSCLVRLAHFSPSCTTFIIEKLSFKEIASTLVKGNPREQQISLNLLNMAILGGQTIANFTRHLISLAEEKQLVPAFLSLIEQGTEVLRGKTLIFMALLCKNSRRWLPHFFCNAKLLSAIDRLLKVKDSFTQNCMESFIELVASTVPGILETVRQIMFGKRHGHVNVPSVRGNPKSMIHLFPVVVHLLGSSSFRNRMVTNQVLSQLADIIKLMESPFQGRDDFQITLLQVLESITEDPVLFLNDPRIFTNQLLPSLVLLYKGNKDGDARFLCLKILFDVMAVFLDSISSKSLKDEGPVMKDLKSISDAYFLPLYPAFIEDEDPIPIYAQKLLVLLIEFGLVKVSEILNLQTISQYFEFLLGDLSTANVNSVKLCLALASTPEMDTKILSQLKVVRKIGNFLEFVIAQDMEDFVEPTLSLCKAFMLHSIGINTGVVHSKEPALLLDTTLDMHVAVEQQHCVKDISDFCSNIGVFLELIGKSELHAADLASECMVLLFKASPRESSMSFLTNLPKISCILLAMHESASNLLLRLMYSLAFSCRHYLSHATILSISVSDVRRIETFVSSLKSSSSKSIAKAASILCLELQRLPHCL